MLGFGKFKAALDWVAYGKLLVDIALAVSGWKFTKLIVSKVHSIPSEWDAPIAWLVSAVILLALLRFWRTPSSVTDREQRSGTGTSLSANAKHSLPPDFDIEEFFRLAYRSPLEEELIKNFRYIAHEKSPQNPEEFYLKILSIGFVQAVNDDIWYRAFRSQLVTLVEVNKNGGWLTTQKAKAVFEEAASANPKAYEKDTFERWLSFLTSNQLLIRHPSEMLEITTRGKDLIRYMAHWGRDIESKRL